MRDTRLLDMATGVAISRIGVNPQWRLGAVGLRNDGVLVSSFNGHAFEPEWTAHAESRLCRKLTPNSVVAVVRVLANGIWAMAKPCPNCQRCLERVGVKRVLYSVDLDKWRVMDLG